ncbi:hypothetical protein EVAR_89744_1 [Eumeta japonica]|uniref:Uncharacterized protein n=1 Tax=Eumeta variegata TaxID=151549 RepID=A0A4C1Y780_EUMVA|nr:hypothetical protein EVAR_89744_1 [Eumeta japonica]
MNIDAPSKPCLYKRSTAGRERRAADLTPVPALWHKCVPNSGALRVRIKLGNILRILAQTVKNYLESNYAEWTCRGGGETRNSPPDEPLVVIKSSPKENRSENIYNSNFSLISPSSVPLLLKHILYVSFGKDDSESPLFAILGLLRWSYRLLSIGNYPLCSASYNTSALMLQVETV